MDVISQRNKFGYNIYYRRISDSEIPIIHPERFQKQNTYIIFDDVWYKKIPNYMVNIFGSDYVQKIYQDILETFNTNYLDLLDPSEQDIIINRLKSHEHLTSLINNHLYDRKPMYDFITSPITLSRHIGAKYKMTIYIIGEQHLITEPCDVNNSISIGDYLAELFEYTDVFIDFYLEVHSKSRFKYSDQYNGIDGIYNRFFGCFNRDINWTPRCHNIRAHYVDMRLEKNHIISSIIFTDYYLEKLDLLNEIMSSREYFENSVLDILKIPQIKKELQRSFLEIEIKDWFHNIVEPFYSDYDKVKSDLDLVNELIKNPFLEDYIKQSPTINDFLQNPDPNPLLEQIFNLIIKLDTFFVILSAVIMDIYTLSRIFKQFNTDGTLPDRPHNIIIYAGDAHCKSYRNFLNYLTIFQSTESDYISKNCISTKKIGQPFFESYI
jgi:hypothetical protein